MTLHLKPETEARLEAHTAAVGMSVDEYLEALIEKLPAEADEPAFQGGRFKRSTGFWSTG